MNTQPDECRQCRSALVHWDDAIQDYTCAACENHQEDSPSKATGIAVKFLVYRYSNQDRTPDWMSAYWYSWYANYETSIDRAIEDATAIVTREWRHAIFKGTTNY